MGCDIHAYIDYTAPFNPEDRCCGLGRIRICRDYVLFGIVAGIRSDTRPVVEPKGMPTVYSYEVQQDYLLWINDHGKEDEPDGTCSSADAKKWVERGQSEYALDGKFITAPDWHTHTWLTLEELKEVRTRYKKAADRDYSPEVTLVEIDAIIGAMSGLAKHKGYIPRLVIWFDN